VRSPCLLARRILPFRQSPSFSFFSPLSSLSLSLSFSLPPSLSLSISLSLFSLFSLLFPSALRFVMLIVSNSGHHRHVYFPFSSPFLPPFRAAHTHRPLLVDKASSSFPAIEPQRMRLCRARHPPFGYHFRDSRLLIISYSFEELAARAMRDGLRYY